MYRSKLHLVLENPLVCSEYSLQSLYFSLTLYFYAAPDPALLRQLYQLLQTPNHLTGSSALASHSVPLQQ